jgi:hypothetical protein
MRIYISTPPYKFTFMYTQTVFSVDLHAVPGLTIHAVVEEEHEIEVVKPGTARKAALKTVFGYTYQAIHYCSYCVNSMHHNFFLTYYLKIFNSFPN